MNLKILLLFFLILTGVIFMTPSEVLAGCGCSCQSMWNENASGNCYGPICYGCVGDMPIIDINPFNYWDSCAINPTSQGTCGGAEGASCSSDPHCPSSSKCQTWKCPSGANNGDPCSVWKQRLDFVTCVCDKYDGSWDASDAGQSKCIQCLGMIESINLADTSNIYSSSNVGDEECESACGASTECDEANDAVGVVVPGGTCNNCVFSATPTSCSWQNDACGQSPCAERHQTCGLAGCSGGVCTPGSTRCIDDLACHPCEETCTCPCPDECPCSRGDCPPELRGGLVPCGRSCNDPCTQICECCPCTLCHLFVLFKRIVDFITINILIPLAILMIVVGGIMFLTAGGDPGRIGGGKKILTATIIGLIIIFLAWMIVNTVITFLTPAGSPFQQWHTINCPVP